MQMLKDSHITYTDLRVRIDFVSDRNRECYRKVSGIVWPEFIASHLQSCKWSKNLPKSQGLPMLVEETFMKAIPLRSAHNFKGKLEGIGGCGQKKMPSITALTVRLYRQSSCPNLQPQIISK